MSNTREARVKIEGTRPIMWHAFGPESIPLEKRKEKTGVAGNDPEEWKGTVLATNKGQLYVRGDYIFGCLRNGAKHTKKGRGSIQKDMSATLQVAEDRILFDRFVPGWNGGPPDELTRDPDELVYLDVRGVRNPTTRARNVRYRVASRPGWACEFTLVWDASIVSTSQMEAVVIDSGKLAGLADGVAIGFGRFKLVSFDVTEA